MASATNSQPLFKARVSNKLHIQLCFHQGEVSVLVKREPLSLFNLIVLQLYKVFGEIFEMTRFPQVLILVHI